MGTTIRNVEGVVILDLPEKLGWQKQGAHSLAAEVEQLFGRGHRYVLLNMENVPFVDSLTLGELLAAKRVALVAGAELKMLRPRSQVYGLLAQTKLENVLECFEDEGAAIRSFQR